jgi:hypothetical protein
MKPKLSDLTDASAVALALEEFGRLGRDDFLVRHGFGKSRDYLVQNPRTNELADSKAIAAAALKHQFPELEATVARVGHREQIIALSQHPDPWVRPARPRAGVDHCREPGAEAVGGS